MAQDFGARFSESGAYRYETAPGSSQNEKNLSQLGTTIPSETLVWISALRPSLVVACGYLASLESMTVGRTYSAKSTVCGINGFLSATADPLPFISSTRLAKLAVLRYVLFPPAAPACLRFQTKNMQQHIFPFVSELHELQSSSPLPPRLTVPRSRNGWLLTVRKRWTLPSTWG